MANKTVETLINKTISGSNNTIQHLPTSSLNDASVTNAKLANMAQATVKGRASGAGTGVPTDLTATQLAAILMGRRILTGPETFTFGDAGQYASPQAAETHVLENIFTNGYDVTYAWDSDSTTPSEFTGAIVLNIAAPLVGGGKRIFRGSDGGEDDVRLIADASGNCVQVSGLSGEIQFTGNWYFEAPSGSGIENQGKGRITNDGIMTFDGTAFNTFINNQHESTSFINGTGAELKFATDASIPIFNDSGTFHDNGTIEFVDAPTFTALYDGNFFSQGYLCNGNAMVGTFTGDRLRLRDRAVLRLQAPANHVIPGTAKGFAQPGSVFSDQGVTANVMVGSATFAASATVAVDFTTEGLPDQYDTDYMVTVGGGVETRTYVVKPADRTTTGFTITASASNSDTVHWRLEWL